MTRKNPIRFGALSAVLLVAVLSIPDQAAALEKAYSRKGLFTGFGLGGGAMFVLDGDPLGDINAHVQAGVGASERLTIAVNIDGRLHVGNEYLGGMLIMGPEVKVFLFEGLYLRIGAGAALTWPDDPDDFTAGFDGSLGLGYEMWVNTNLTAFLGLNADYIVLSDANDMIFAGMSFGIRYY